MTENLAEASDYKTCPEITASMMAAPMRAERVEELLEILRCHGSRCAWWDADKEKCAVLSLARSAARISSQK